MSRKLIIGASVLSVANGLLLAIWVARIVARPLNDAIGVAQRVASGDLTADIDIRSRDETGMVMSSLRAMNQSLAHVVGQVRLYRCHRHGIGADASGNMDLSAAPRGNPVRWKKPRRPWKR